MLRIFPLYYGILFLAFIILPLVHLPTSSITQQDAIYFLSFTANIKFALSGWTHHAFDPYSSCRRRTILFTVAAPPTSYPAKISCKACPVRRLQGALPCVFFVSCRNEFPFSLHDASVPCRWAADRGALACFVSSQTKLPISGPRMSIVLSILVAMFFLAGSFHWFGLNLYYDAWNTRGALFYYPTIALGYGVMLYLCITRSNPVQFLFKNAPLRAVGKYSYCLYLIHVPIMHLFHSNLQPVVFERLSNSLPSFAQDLVQLTPLFLISFVCAAASWHFFERPLASA